jgi:hypothetical protein
MGQRVHSSVSNTPPVALVRLVVFCKGAYSLCIGVRARGQREPGSVSNTPPGALVRSALCSGAPTPSAEMRGLGGGGSVALCQIHPQVFLSGQYFVAVLHLLSA